MHFKLKKLILVPKTIKKKGNEKKISWQCKNKNQSKKVKKQNDNSKRRSHQLQWY
jgi:hypothetical protein